MIRVRETPITLAKQAKGPGFPFEERFSNSFGRDRGSLESIRPGRIASYVGRLPGTGVSSSTDGCLKNHSRCILFVEGECRREGSTRTRNPALPR